MLVIQKNQSQKNPKKNHKRNKLSKEVKKDQQI